MKDIIVKEQHRLGEHVSVAVLNPENESEVIYDRYVLASEWDSDPELLAAKISKYLSDREDQAPPASSIPIKENPIRLKKEDVELKLQVYEAARVAEMSSKNET